MFFYSVAIYSRDDFKLFNGRDNALYQKLIFTVLTNFVLELLDLSFERFIFFKLSL